MSHDLGKTVATVRLLDGNVVNFFNKTHNMTGSVIYKDASNTQELYRYNADTNEASGQYRACYFTRSFAQSADDVAPNMLFYIPNSKLVGEPPYLAMPLYQFISPSITRLGADEYQISWWSNVENYKESDTYEKIYNDDRLYKFNAKDPSIDSGKANGITKILCTANIHWEQLFISTNGAGQGLQSKLTPIIVNPVILAAISGEGFITDFSTGEGGGGGGGMSMHTHTSNLDGGFAAAVFMPSATMKPVNWS